MAAKVSFLRTITLPMNKGDFVTRVVTEDYTILLRLRWCPIVKSWFLNVRNSDNINVGFPIVLKPNIGVFVVDEDHGRIRACMARPEGLPKGVGFAIFSKTEVTQTSFNDGSATFTLLEE